jgi:hypothetical protein
MYITMRQADIYVTIDGLIVDGSGSTGSWATAEGGTLTADDTKTRPGGMGNEVSVGGNASRDDLTVTTQWTDLMAGLEQGLENGVGISSVGVQINWLTAAKAPLGQGNKNITGTLKSVKQPDANTGSSDVGMLTLVISCDEVAANG